jgi:hypothetical protein
MKDCVDDDLGGVLDRSMATLREEVPVRSAWRAELLARVERDAPPARLWRVRPIAAIAAGVALLLAGAAIGRFARPSDRTPSVARTSTSSNASVRFVYVAPGAAKVSVVGDFNQWNASAMPLRRLSDGTWIVDVPLSPGVYAYAFLVDGKIEVDPVAPRANSEFGAKSILMVHGS